MEIDVKCKNKIYKMLIDEEDFSLFQGRKVNYTGSEGNRYCRIKLNNVSIRVHRLIMNFPINKQVDHINGNTLDNRKCNLRVCDRIENNRNRLKSSKAKYKYKGVRPKKNKWEARITFNNKQINLGYFKTEIEAAQAYDEAAIRYFGQFARLNKGE